MQKKHFKLDKTAHATKLKQLIHGIQDAIIQGKFTEGEFLPSINEVSRDYKLSRDTVFKAYSELKRRNVIESAPMKGYRVLGKSNRVMLILDVFSSYKDILYNAFIDALPEDYTADLVFHHYNAQLFETVILNNIGKYQTFVVMSFEDKLVEDTLKKIPSDQLLILDMISPKNEQYSFICQDFNQSFYNSLKESARSISKYREFVLYYPPRSKHLDIALETFKKFCKDYKVQQSVLRTKLKKEDIKLRRAFIVFRQSDMVQVVKFCRLKSLKLGIDVGLIAYNDQPVHEFIEEGITSISTDFELMGKKAAAFVQYRQPIKEYIPTSFIKRSSF